MGPRDERDPNHLKILVQRFFQVVDSKNWDLLASLISTDATIQVGNSSPVKFSESQNLKALYEAFPDGHHVFDQYIEQDEYIVTKGRFEGTHSGVFRTVSPTGAKVSFGVIHIDRFKSDKLIEHLGQPDMLSLMRQIGAIQ